MDKEEIIARSRKIGTYSLSARVREHCAITEDRPATATRPRVLDAAETGLDPALLNRLVDEADVVDIGELDLAELAGRSLFVAEVVEGAVRVDMRPDDARGAVPWPGSVARSYEELVRNFKEFSEAENVVLVCAQGLLSAQIAERMQEAGIEAYSFRGGDRALRRYLETDRASAGAVGEGRR
jgi:thiamine biosynthesis protein ThiI